MNTVEPMMGFGTFLLLFLFGLWAGGAIEWVYRHWQRDKRERERDRKQRACQLVQRSMNSHGRDQ